MDERNRAVDLLTFYICQLYGATGLEWSYDNYQEVSEIVDLIIAASKLNENPTESARLETTRRAQ